MCSYDNKTKFFHEWIGFKKKTGNSKKAKFIMDLYPARKVDECEMLADMMTDKELIALGVEYGMEESEVKKLIK